MLSLGSEHRFLLYREHCDMRKSFNALSGLVRNELGHSPASGEVFIFINKRRTHMKLLHWEAGGFVLYYKRLEKGTFSIPEPGEKGELSWPDLILMIEGIRVQKCTQKPRFLLPKKIEKT